MTKAKENLETGGAVELSEMSLAQVEGGTRSSLTQKIVIRQDAVGDTTTSTDDVFVDGNIITAETC